METKSETLKDTIFFLRNSVENSVSECRFKKFIRSGSNYGNSFHYEVVLEVADGTTKTLLFNDKCDVVLYDNAFDAIKNNVNFIRIERLTYYNSFSILEKYFGIGGKYQGYNYTSAGTLIYYIWDEKARKSRKVTHNDAFKIDFLNEEVIFSAELDKFEFYPTEDRCDEANLGKFKLYRFGDKKEESKTDRFEEEYNEFRKIFNGLDFYGVTKKVKELGLTYGAYNPNVTTDILDINYKSILATINFVAKVSGKYDKYDESGKLIED